MSKNCYMEAEVKSNRCRRCNAKIDAHWRLASLGIPANVRNSASFTSALAKGEVVMTIDFPCGHMSWGTFESDFAFSCAMAWIHVNHQTRYHDTFDTDQI